MEAIERVQCQAARIITGTWKGTSTNKLYEGLGWETLSDRRGNRCIIQYFKVHNRLTPAFLYENLPTKRLLLYGRTNPYIYHNILFKTSRYKNSFSLMPLNLRTILASIAIFKKKIYAFIRPVTKTTYDIHYSKGLKFIFILGLD